MAFRPCIPFVMPFVRCRGGLGHNLADYAGPEDIDMGARFLLDFIGHLAPSNS
jgi:hypothetical protein